ncbi:transposase [Halomonas pelophila]|uniref:transposase n=1 Tax=Halomonas pelophila TaxID=3151122 RepID=UPI003D80D50C
MARQSTPMKKKLIHYSDAYREEALTLADRVVVIAVTRELGIQPSQLYQWHVKVQQK